MSAKAQIDATLASQLASLPPGLLIGTAYPLRLLSHYATPPAPQAVPFVHWASEHARLVVPMCPGGLRPLAAYTPSSSPTDMRNAALIARAMSATLVVSIGSGNRPIAKTTAKYGDIDLRSTDLRSVKSLITSTVTIKTVLHVPTVMASSDKGCEERLLSLLEASAVSICRTLVVDLGDERLLADMLAWKPSPTPKGKKKAVATPGAQTPIQAEVLLPVGEPSPQEGDHRVHSRGTPVCMSGAMYINAVVMQEATLGNALAALREDACRSVRARLQLLREVEEDGEGVHRTMCMLPVRVVAQPKSGSHLLPMSEYVLEGESVKDDVTSRLVEVLSWTETELKAYRLVEVECIAVVEPTGTNHAVSAGLIPQGNPTSMRTLDIAAKAPVAYVYQALIAAVFVAILAIVYKFLTDG